MTDPGFADRTYLEPLDAAGRRVGAGARAARRAAADDGRADGAQPRARACRDAACSTSLGVELIGAPPAVIRRAEDREEFRETVASVGLRSPESVVVTEPRQLPATCPSRSSCARPSRSAATAAAPPTRPRSSRCCSSGRWPRAPVGQVLVEESLIGWDEFELELMRDRNDNVVIVCSIENLDPMGVHTGDSVTVAPQMTLCRRGLPGHARRRHRRHPRRRRRDRRRQHPVRPLARERRAARDRAEPARLTLVRARLQGDRLPDRQGRRQARHRLHARRGSQRPHEDHAGQLRAHARLRRRQVPALRLREVPRRRHHPGHPDEGRRRGHGHRPHLYRSFPEGDALRELDTSAAAPWKTLDDVPAGVHPWFLAEFARIRSALDGCLVARLARPQADRPLGCGHRAARGSRRTRPARPSRGRRPPVFRRVDSCAGEVEAASNYFYSTWGEAERGRADGEAPRVVILGSGPNRIGQGIEFDYCCVHAAQSFRSLGYEAVMVNCNPETVSTDYDTSDRLYFEPLGAEEVLAVCERERPDGIAIQFGGQTPLKLAPVLAAAGYTILGTPHDAVDLAEDRERFAALCDRSAIRCPDWGIARDPDAAVEVAERVGYPVLVRPSHVLGGRSMRVCYSADDVREAMAGIQGPTLVDRFLEGAVEIDVDALCDGEDTWVAAVMQHVEEAGVHSGDSSCVLPPPSLDTTRDRADRPHARPRTRRHRARQRPARDRRTATCSCSRPTRARRAPSPSPARRSASTSSPPPARSPPANRLADLDLPWGRTPAEVSVKAAVLPFTRFPGSDPVLGPEMRSTGEVMASGQRLPHRLRQSRARRRPPPPRQAAPSSSPSATTRSRRSCRRRPRARRPRVRPRRHLGHRGRAHGRRAARGPAAQGDRGRGRGRRSSTSSAGAAATSSSTRRRARAPARTATASARRRSSPASRASRRSPARRPRPRPSPSARAESALSLQERHAQARSA